MDEAEKRDGGVLLKVMKQLKTARKGRRSWKKTRC